jgi:hypothetical protein
MNRNRRSSIMKRAVVSLVFLALVTGAASAQEPTLGTLARPGDARTQEFLTWSLPPGSHGPLPDLA